MTAQNTPAAPLAQLDEALKKLVGHATPLEDIENVPILEADGRVLAKPVVSALNVPPHDNTAMDGYAVRASTVIAPQVELNVSQRIPAGRKGEPLAPGSAARVFTGAPVPEGADAIVMQENTTELDGGARVRINVKPNAGDWIRKAGEDISRGSFILQKGEILTPASLGLAASVGKDTLQVTRRPKVALFSTGDELVMPGAIPPEQMPPGAIYNSNRFFLTSLLKRMGCEVHDMGVVPDRRDATLLALKSAMRNHDVILSSGGVSMGEEDHIKAAIRKLGTLDMWQIAMKPGKPFAYGQLAKTGQAGQTSPVHFIGLPGNPVSSFVTFLLLVRPFLLRLQGVRHITIPVSVERADFEWAKAGNRREFLRAKHNAKGGLDLYTNQSSGVLNSMHWADGLIDLPAGKTIAAGDSVRFISIKELLI